MSVFLLTSATHSPGVTTAAVALALNSGEPTLLVDANREPDQAVLAGYLRGTDPQGCGLGGLLQAYREHHSLASALPSMLLPLGDDSAFLPGFAHPGMVSLFTAVWPELADALEADPRPVYVDAGRLGATGLPPALVAASSAVAVVTRTALPDLAALRLYLPQVLEAAGVERVGLVLVGPGRPYQPSEIRKRFDVPIWGELSWQPLEVERYALGVSPRRRRNCERYRDDVRALAARLAERDVYRRTLIGTRQ